ncbi:MAG: FAD-binding protein [Pseudomonadota bacterium]
MNLSPTRGEGTPTPTPQSSPAPSTRLQDIAGNGIVIEPPTPVDNAAALSWDDAADVVVIGFGGAGAAAALQARESGASVLVVERFAGGGTTALSGGVFYAGGGTRIQVDAGVADSVDDLFDYLRQERKDAVSEATLRRFCAQSPETVDWLMRHGVPFEGSLYSDKTNYPPDGKYLYFSGNEKTPAFAAKAKPAPRGHRTVGTGLTGAVYFRALYAAVERSGIRVRTHSRAVRLITDAAATVIGIEILAITEPQHQRRHQALYAQLDPRLPFSSARAERAIARAFALEREVGVIRRIRARNGVILATGGFSYNAAMLAQQIPFLARHKAAFMRLGTIGCSGAGIQLGVSVGAATGALDRVCLGRMISPPDALVRGLIVNQEGTRFINEDAYNALLGAAISKQPEGKAWIILDRALHRRLLRQLMPSKEGNFQTNQLPALLNRLFGGTKKARTLDGLAQKIGVEPAALSATANQLAQALARQQPDPLGKHPDYCNALGDGPYWALNTSLDNKFAFFIFFTLGGLAIDEQRGVVLREDGTPIEGLYAAGRTAVGIPSDGYISGMSLADCVFAGRRAGRACAAAPDRPPDAASPSEPAL